MEDNNPHNTNKKGENRDTKTDTAAKQGKKTVAKADKDGKAKEQRAKADTKPKASKAKPKATDPTRAAQDETIMNNLPGDARWIKQPYALSVMRGDLTLTQTHIMVEMMEALQEKINNFIAHMDQDGASVFREEDFDRDGLAHVDVNLAAVSNRPDYYSDVENMAYRLMAATIRRPEQVDGMKMVKIAHVFDSIYVPFENNDRARRKGFIRFCFNREQAREIFSFTRYSKYLKAVARNASSQYTSRLYMIITAYKAFGHWEVDYSELRKILGFLAYEQAEDGHWQWTEKKYTEYRQFKRRVLATAADELRQLAMKGEADCYFDYAEIYPEGKTKGTPLRIHFTITLSPMGKQLGIGEQRARQIAQLEKLLRERLDFRAAQANPILARVNEDNIQQTIQKAEELALYTSDPDHRVDDKRKYAFAALRNLLDDMERQPETHADEAAAATNTQQESPSAQDDKWSGTPFSASPLREALTAAFGTRTYTMYLMQIRIANLRGKRLLLHIPHEEISNYIDTHNLLPLLRDTLSLHLGPVQAVDYLVGG